MPHTLKPTLAAFALGQMTPLDFEQWFCKDCTIFDKLALYLQDPYECVSLLNFDYKNSKLSRA